jgi:hypothetical protein
MLTSAVVVPPVGRLTNRMSYGTPCLGSLLAFSLASAACAMAWSYESLIAARILQAMGGGAIPPIGMANQGGASRAARAGQGPGHLGHGHHGRSVHRTNHGRHPDRRVQLADDLLGQSAGGSPDPAGRQDCHGSVARPRRQIGAIVGVNGLP